jgi:hypothetical protein
MGQLATEGHGAGQRTDFPETSNLAQAGMGPDRVIRMILGQLLIEGRSAVMLTFRELHPADRCDGLRWFVRRVPGLEVGIERLTSRVENQHRCAESPIEIPVCEAFEEFRGRLAAGGFTGDSTDAGLPELIELAIHFLKSSGVDFGQTLLDGQPLIPDRQIHEPQQAYRGQYHCQR